MTQRDRSSEDGFGGRRPADKTDGLDEPYGRRALGASADRVVQLDGGGLRGPGGDGPAEVHEAAAHGTSGASQSLPYLGAIQQSFGRHDVGEVQAHVDGAAHEGATAMGARAFATGDHVAFAGTPDLHTAAHEAAHVVQQRAGVHLAGGVGHDGDPYERHADAVADLVVAGRSSETVLDDLAGARGSASGQVQQVVQRRSVNPLPSSTTGTQVPGEIGATMSEHHLIPHSLLEKFWKAAVKLVDEKDVVAASGAILNDWGDVTVKQLVDSRELDAACFDDDEVRRILGDRDLATLRPLKVTAVFTQEVVTALRDSTTPGKKLARAVPFVAENWAHAKAGGHDENVNDEEPDMGNLVNLVAPYYEWMPGNLVVGPEGAVRAADPKDKYDAEAARALVDEHRTCIEGTRDRMLVATGNGNKSTRTEATRAALEGVKTLGTTYTTKAAPPVKQGEDDVVAAPYWHKAEDGWRLVGRS